MKPPGTLSLIPKQNETRRKSIIERRNNNEEEGVTRSNIPCNCEAGALVGALHAVQS